MRFFLAILLLGFSAVSFSAPFTSQQEARIREMIRETLVANPDILAAAVDAWQQESSQARVKEVIQSQRQALYQDPASPRIGAKKPRLTLVSFTDYNCPFCKQFDPQLEKLVREHPEVALIIKPLPFRGESSMSAARLALTAWRERPQRFLALHQRLMAKKGYHDDASIRAAQQKTGVDGLQADALSMITLRGNLQLAEQLGIQGTPATLVGDELIAGAITYDELAARVKQQLENDHDG